MTLKLEQAFGQVLRKIRQEKGFSQEALAFECGVHRTYISLLERGLKSPSLNTMMLLSKTLDIKLSEFFQQVEKALK